eukprot:scaffold216_cov78-Isochrysis_galbana.AAC.1
MMPHTMRGSSRRGLAAPASAPGASTADAAEPGGVGPVPRCSSTASAGDTAADAVARARDAPTRAAGAEPEAAVEAGLYGAAAEATGAAGLAMPSSRLGHSVPCRSLRAIRSAVANSVPRSSA